MNGLRISIIRYHDLSPLVTVGYFFRLVLGFGVVAVVFVEVIAGSGSSGAGGGVVSIVHPIHPDMTRTRRTNNRTGIPTAISCQPVAVDGLNLCRPGIHGEKKATTYATPTTTEMMNMANP